MLKFILKKIISKYTIKESFHSSKKKMLKVSISQGKHDISLSKLQEIVKDREAWHAAGHGVPKSWTQLSDWATTSQGCYWAKRLCSCQIVTSKIFSPIDNCITWISTRTQILISKSYFLLKEIKTSMSNFSSDAWEVHGKAKTSVCVKARKCWKSRTSLVVQWLKLHLSVQGMQVQFLVKELTFHMLRGN